MNRMRGELWEMGSTITDSQLASHQKNNPPRVKPAGSLGLQNPHAHTLHTGGVALPHRNEDHT
jgi:hypothetical protein